MARVGGVATILEDWGFQFDVRIMAYVSPDGYRIPSDEARSIEDYPQHVAVLEKMWSSPKVPNQTYIALFPGREHGPRQATIEETEYAEAIAEVEKICQEVKKDYELYDWVAANEVEAIAPGWKD